MPAVAGYSDLTQIGQGGFGTVYRATQDELGRPVALKILPGLRDDAETYARFERECRALGAVGAHPNIATVYDAGHTQGGEGYLALELLDGGTLAQRISDGPFDDVTTASIGVALAGALETAHRAGVLHRDIKPANIMFDRLDAPKLLDFGIASMPGAFATNSASTSLTLAHAAPEVIAGARSTAASDVYSLSSTLYACVAGSAPHARTGEETLVPLLARIASEPVPDLRELGIDAGLATVIERGLAKDPAQRTSSAGELGMALAAWLEAAGHASAGPAILNPTAAGAAAATSASSGAASASEATAPKTAPAARRPWRRRPVLLGAVAAVLLLGGSATAYAIGAQDEPEPSLLATGASGDASPAAPGAGALPSGSSTAAVPPVAGGNASPGADPGATTGVGVAPPNAAGGPAASAPATAGSSESTRKAKAPRAGTVATVVPAMPGAGTAGFSAALDHNNSGDPTRVRLVLNWGSSSGSPTSYVLRGTPRNAPHSRTYTSTVASSGATVTVPAVHDPNGYFEWSVAARNAAGTSGYRTLRARVVDMTGEVCNDATQMARAAGLRTSYTASASPGSKSDEYRVAGQGPGSGSYEPGSRAVSLTCFGAY